MNEINKISSLNLFFILILFITNTIFIFLGYSYSNKNLFIFNEIKQEKQLFENELKKQNYHLKFNNDVISIIIKDNYNISDLSFLKKDIQSKINFLNGKENEYLNSINFELKKIFLTINNSIKSNIINIEINKNIQNGFFKINNLLINNISTQKINDSKLINNFQTNNSLYFLIFLNGFIIFTYFFIFILKHKKLDHLNHQSIFKYQNILNTSLNPLIVLNEEGNIIETNKQFLNLTKRQRKNVLESNYKDIFNSNDIKKLLNNELTEEETKFLFLFQKGKLQDSSSNIIEVEYSISVSENLDEDEEETLYVVVFKDLKEITKLSNENKRLRQLAQKDPLTGLFNRRYIIDKTEEEFYQLYSKKPFSVLYIDIDHFKKVNDSYGHEAGDFVLREFSKLVGKEIRENDIFGRIGGEEFALILSNTPYDKVKHIAERIRERIAEYNFKYQLDNINITISIGGCYFNNTEETTFQDCLQCADKALYESKKQGRNKVSFFKQ